MTAYSDGFLPALQGSRDFLKYCELIGKFPDFWKCLQLLTLVLL